MQTLLAEQRRRWKDEKNPRGLGLLMMEASMIFQAQRDLPHFWLCRAIVWEVILTPLLEDADNTLVIETKRAAFGQGQNGSFFFVTSPVSEADTEAIRQDTANLIVCYVNQLQDAYIPRTTLLPTLPNESSPPDPREAVRLKTDPVYRAKVLQKEAESESNYRKNVLTLRLHDALSALQVPQMEAAFDYFVYAYSRPPAAEEELAWLLDFLEYPPEARERLRTRIGQVKAFLREEADKQRMREGTKAEPGRLPR